MLEDCNNNPFVTLEPTKKGSNQTTRLAFEITQIDYKLLLQIRQILGFGIVYSFKHKEQTYYRYYTSKKKSILALLTLMNGNLILEKRQQQFKH